MNATSPKSSLAKLGLYPRQKAIKVMVLGQAGVGKSALIVRFITRRYIGEYSSTLEKVYTFQTVIDNELVYFEILDSISQQNEKEALNLESNIRWAEAFILMYSVTDKCSFDECYRLKFLINYNKRRRRLGSSSTSKDGIGDVPVVLVGNKTDQIEDRMVTTEEGEKRCKEIGCVCFHEISVQENIDQVWAIFRDVCRFWRVLSKNPRKLRRSGSERTAVSPETSEVVNSTVVFHTSSRPTCRPLAIFGRRWTEVEVDVEEEEDETKYSSSNKISTLHGAFRKRASTDGHILQKSTWRVRCPSSGAAGKELARSSNERRMSISMKGNNVN